MVSGSGTDIVVEVSQTGVNDIPGIAAAGAVPVPVSATLAFNSVPPPLQCPGDFDNNGIVNSIDYALFVSHWGTRAGGPNWDAKFDLSSDGVISSTDYAIFISNWGKTCSPRDPGDGQTNPDRDALVALYNATNGDNWTNNANWLSDKPLGEWHGVTTDANGRVTRLWLRKNELSGSLPSSLGNLAKLQDMYLGINDLSGELPPSFGNLTNLQTLDLQGNKLSGVLPGELTGLGNLSFLRLNGTQLCAPTDAAFQTWLQGIENKYGVTNCEDEDGKGYRQRRTKLVDTQPLLVPPPSPVSFAGDFWINQIDATSAWAALSDPGVRLVPNAIGIIDTGVPSSQDVLNSSRISRYSEEGVSMSGDDTSHPHGYNVTGYAAGYGNGPDRRGVNPHSDVVFVDVLDPTGNVYNTTLMLGIKTAIDKSAGVVNISWAPGALHQNQPPSVRQDVMQKWRRSYNGVVHYARRRDVLLVWASGNEWEKQYDRLLPLKNGAIDVANTDSWLSHSLIVGASTESQMDACFSLMGAAVNIMAPGQDVGFGVGTGNGTSYAAPMVTGAAGLIRAIESTVSAEETRSILINSARNAISFNTDCIGEPVASSPAGLLNLGSAIQSSLVADGIGLNIAGDVHLARGQMANVSINVTVPSGGVHAIDVGFVIDQSGSYEDDIQTLQNRATEIVNNFKARTDVDVQFGVVGFADFPQSPYGRTGDVPYRLYQSITDDQNALIAAADYNWISTLNDTFRVD